jgi:hypothetical protein
MLVEAGPDWVDYDGEELQKDSIGRVVCIEPRDSSTGLNWMTSAGKLPAVVKDEYELPGGLLVYVAWNGKATHPGGDDGEETPLERWFGYVVAPGHQALKPVESFLRDSSQFPPLRFAFGAHVQVALLSSSLPCEEHKHPTTGIRAWTPNMSGHMTWVDAIIIGRHTSLALERRCRSYWDPHLAPDPSATAFGDPWNPSATDVAPYLVALDPSHAAAVYCRPADLEMEIGSASAAIRNPVGGAASFNRSVIRKMTQPEATLFADCDSDRSSAFWANLELRFLRAEQYERLHWVPRTLAGWHTHFCEQRAVAVRSAMGKLKSLLDDARAALAVHDPAACLTALETHATLNRTFQRRMHGQSSEGLDAEFMQYQSRRSKLLKPCAGCKKKGHTNSGEPCVDCSTVEACKVCKKTLQSVCHMEEGMQGVAKKVDHHALCHMVSALCVEIVESPNGSTAELRRLFSPSIVESKLFGWQLEPGFWRHVVATGLQVACTAACQLAACEDTAVVDIPRQRCRAQSLVLTVLDLAACGPGPGFASGVAGRWSGTTRHVLPKWCRQNAARLPPPPSGHAKERQNQQLRSEGCVLSVPEVRSLSRDLANSSHGGAGGVSTCGPRCGHMSSRAFIHREFLKLVPDRKLQQDGGNQVGVRLDMEQFLKSTMRADFDLCFGVSFCAINPALAAAYFHYLCSGDKAGPLVRDFRSDLQDWARGSDAFDAKVAAEPAEPEGGTGEPHEAPPKGCATRAADVALSSMQSPSARSGPAVMAHQAQKWPALTFVLRHVPLKSIAVIVARKHRPRWSPPPSWLQEVVRMGRPHDEHLGGDDFVVQQDTSDARLAALLEDWLDRADELECLQAEVKWTAGAGRLAQHRGGSTPLSQHLLAHGAAAVADAVRMQMPAVLQVLLQRSPKGKAASMPMPKSDLPAGCPGSGLPFEGAKSPMAYCTGNPLFKESRTGALMLEVLLRYVDPAVEFERASREDDSAAMDFLFSDWPQELTGAVIDWGTAAAQMVGGHQFVAACDVCRRLPELRLPGHMDTAAAVRKFSEDFAHLLGLLLERGAPVTDAALFAAVDNAKPQACELLLTHAEAISGVRDSDGALVQWAQLFGCSQEWKTVSAAYVVRELGSHITQAQLAQWVRCGLQLNQPCSGAGQELALEVALCNGSGREQLLQWLVSLGADVRVPNPITKRTALHAAARLRSSALKYVRLLLEESIEHGSGYDTGLKDGEDMTLKALLEGKADLGKENKSVMALLARANARHLAAQKEEKEARQKKQKKKRKVKKQLLQACQLADTERAKSLLTSHPEFDVKAVDAEGGNGMLHMLSFARAAVAEKAAEEAVEFAAAADAAAMNGLSPVLDADELQVRVQELPFNQRALKLTDDQSGAWMDSADCASWLLESEFSQRGLKDQCRLRNNHGHTPLHLACSASDEPLAGVLLQYGADAEAFNGNGDTALHIACRLGLSTAVAALCTQMELDSNGERRLPADKQQALDTPTKPIQGGRTPQTPWLLAQEGRDLTLTDSGVSITKESVARTQRYDATVAALEGHGAKTTGRTAAQARAEAQARAAAAAAAATAEKEERERDAGSAGAGRGGGGGRSGEDGTAELSLPDLKARVVAAVDAYVTELEAAQPASSPNASQSFLSAQPVALAAGTGAVGGHPGVEGADGVGVGDEGESDEEFHDAMSSGEEEGRAEQEDAAPLEQAAGEHGAEDEDAAPQGQPLQTAAVARRTQPRSQSLSGADRVASGGGGGGAGVAFDSKVFDELPWEVECTEATIKWFRKHMGKQHDMAEKVVQRLPEIARARTLTYTHTIHSHTGIRTQAHRHTDTQTHARAHRQALLARTDPHSSTHRRTLAHANHCCRSR